MSAPIAGTTRFSVHRLAPTLLALLGACGSSDDDSDLVLRTTTQSAEPSAPIVVAGDWMVYFASENLTGPAGTDLNGDTDTTDQVAFSVNLRSSVERNLAVAARGAVIVGADVYLVVDEALDGTDWNGIGGIGGEVLLHWSAAADMVTFVDTPDLSSGELPLAVDGRLYYAAEAAFVGVGETNLRALVAGSTTPVTIVNDTSPENVRAHLVGQDEGLVFCLVDEVENGFDRNGDGDALDQHVLALLDGNDDATMFPLRNVALAMQDDSDPLAARPLGTDMWRVAFLVDEASQGGNNLNDQPDFSQPLLPETCIIDDTDALDQVLFFLDIDFASAAALQPVSTGLAGHGRVLLLDGFVATISDELDANCNLNAATGDTDMNDEVARWVATTTPIAPAREPEQLHALATGVGGGSMGLSILDDRLIAVIDEGDDSSNLDGKAADHTLVAWLDPAIATPVWEVSHQAETNGCCGASPPSTCRFGTGIFDAQCDSEPFAGTTWLAAEAVGDRLALVFLEEVPGTNTAVNSLNTNLDCALVAKDSDKTDGLPTWADFEAGPTLDFDGVGYSVDKANAGIEIAAGYAFFRVSEGTDSDATHDSDYNDDGDENDVVLFRNPLLACEPVPMATSSLVPGQVITTDGLSGAAFLSSESQAGIDFNDDGDTTDLVVRFFAF